MNKLLVKNISLFAGGTIVFTAGLFYALMTDLKMSNSATWLFIGIILALGSSIMFLLSEAAKEKVITFYILKFASALLSIGYVVFLFIFKNSKVVTSIILPEKQALANTIIIITMVVTILGLALEIVNIVFNFLTRNDE